MANLVERPGTILRRRIKEGTLSVNATANRLGINPRRLFDIILGRKPITLELAQRLSQIYPNTTTKYWLLLQTDYDLYDANIRLDILEEQDKERQILERFGGGHGNDSENVGMQEHTVQDRGRQTPGIQKGLPGRKDRTPL